MYVLLVLTISSFWIDQSLKTSELFKDWDDYSIRPDLLYDWVKPNFRPRGGGGMAAAMHGKNTCVGVVYR